MISSGAAVPLTGGASGTLTVIGYSAAVASTLQCGIGGFRTRIELSEPSLNDRMDDNEWYRNAVLALDAISLGGAGAAGMLTIRSVKLLKSQDLTTRQALDGLNRAQRARLTEEIVRLNHPRISNGMIKYLRRSGGYPRRYSNAQLKRATALRLKDALGAGLSFTGSAVGGVVRNVAVGIYEEID